ncbi:MAG: OadG family transporter subunit [Christensenellales bacterium]|jgi:sodium pump decarboxylase gamma subunit
MKFTFGLTVMLLGLLIVFIGLILLIIIVEAISRIVNKAAKEKEAPAPAVELPAQVAAEPEPEEVQEDENIPYVIAAAIAACEDSTKKFVVRSVRRVGSGWAANARREQIIVY